MKSTHVVSFLGVVVLCSLTGLAIAKRSSEPNRSRPAAEQCSVTRGRDALQPRERSACKADADCKAGKNGVWIPS